MVWYMKDEYSATSLRSLSIPGSEPMENWPESYLDIIYRWPTAKMNWTSHAIFKFTWVILHSVFQLVFQASVQNLLN